MKVQTAEENGRTYSVIIYRCHALYGMIVVLTWDLGQGEQDVSQRCCSVCQHGPLDPSLGYRPTYSRGRTG